MAPRTTLTKTTAPGGYSSALTVVTMTAADVANGNQFRASGSDLLIIQNTGSTQRTFTITSTTDPYNRSGTITAETIDAGVIKVFGPLAPLGWLQSDGYIYCSATHAEVKFGVVAL